MREIDAGLLRVDRWRLSVDPHAGLEMQARHCAGRHRRPRKRWRRRSPAYRRCRRAGCPPARRRDWRCRVPGTPPVMSLKLSVSRVSFNSRKKSFGLPSTRPEIRPPDHVEARRLATCRCRSRRRESSRDRPGNRRQRFDADLGAADDVSEFEVESRWAWRRLPPLRKINSAVRSQSRASTRPTQIERYARLASRTQVESVCKATPTLNCKGVAGDGRSASRLCLGVNPPAAAHSPCAR